MNLRITGEGDPLSATAWFWLDARPPKAGDVEVRATHAGWDLVPSGFRDHDSRVVSYVVGQATRRASRDCSEPIVETNTPSIHVPWDGPADDAVVVCAVDEAGNRIGMGGGFYDRTFAYRRYRTGFSRPRLVGVAFEFQRRERIDAADWDVPLDAAVTENAWQEFPRQHR